MKYNYLETGGYKYPLSPALVRVANERIRQLESTGHLKRNSGDKFRVLFAEQTGTISFRIGDAEFPLNLRGFVGQDGSLHLDLEEDREKVVSPWSGNKTNLPKRAHVRRFGRDLAAEVHFFIGLPGNILIAALVLTILFV